MSAYSDKLTVRNARSRFFRATGFSEAEYGKRWLAFRFGPIPVVMFNSRERQRAVPMHDLHHILTGYDTSIIGEAEVGAWELGSGCKDFYAAWFYDLFATGIGMAVDWKRTARAFARGRRSRNLYGRAVDEQLLSKRLGVLRRELMPMERRQY